MQGLFVGVEGGDCGEIKLCEGSCVLQPEMPSYPPDAILGIGWHPGGRMASGG